MGMSIDIIQMHTSQMDTKKKPLNIFKNVIDRIKGKTRQNKNIVEHKPEDVTKESTRLEIKVAPIEDTLRTLKINTDNVESDDEEANFTYTQIEEDKRSERLESQSSEDSGFSEPSDVKYEEISANRTDKTKHETDTKTAEDKTKCEDITKELTDKLDELNIAPSDDDKKNKKKKHTVFLARTPIRKRDVKKHQQADPPYPTCVNLEPINKINRQILSGGQVIIKSSVTTIEPSVTSEVIERDKIEAIVLDLKKPIEKQPFNPQNIDIEQLQLINEYIEDDINSTREDSFPEELLLWFLESDRTQPPPPIETHPPPNQYQSHNPVEDFYSIDRATRGPEITVEEKWLLGDQIDVFPTPPRSETIPSPVSMQTSPHLYNSTSNSPFHRVPSPGHFCDDALSPPAIPRLGEHESFQRLDGALNLAESLESLDQAEADDAKKEKRLTLKQFKLKQEEIAAEFAKKECCRRDSPSSSKQYYEERLERLTPEVRSSLCLKIPLVPLKNIYPLLQKVLLSISRGSNHEDLDMCIFRHLCQRVLSEKPDLFLGEFGLNLIETALVRCYRLPALTQLLAECVRAAERCCDPEVISTLTHGAIFDKLQMRDGGESVVNACIRVHGDCAAPALQWLVMKQEAVGGATQPRDMFDLSRPDTLGYNALHTACKHHTAARPQLHVVHLLLAHAQLDLWQGDLKGGDTPLHLAVASAHCDLALVLYLFRHVPRQERWRHLVHNRNKSHMRPIEYARSAMKSHATYPKEVYAFFKKCR